MRPVSQPASSFCGKTCWSKPVHNKEKNKAVLDEDDDVRFSVYAAPPGQYGRFRALGSHTIPLQTFANAMRMFMMSEDGGGYEGITHITYLIRCAVPVSLTTTLISWLIPLVWCCAFVGIYMWRFCVTSPMDVDSAMTHLFILAAGLVVILEVLALFVQACILILGRRSMSHRVLYSSIQIKIEHLIKWISGVIIVLSVVVLVFRLASHTWTWNDDVCYIGGASCIGLFVCLLLLLGRRCKCHKKHSPGTGNIQTNTALDDDGLVETSPLLLKADEDSGEELSHPGFQ